MTAHCTRSADSARNRLVDRNGRDPVRDQSGRSGEPDVGAEAGQQPGVGARDAAVADIAADRDLEAFDPTEPVADRGRVEQGLGRVLVRPVAGIEHRRVHEQRDRGRRAILSVPHHQRIGPHRIQRARRVLESLAFLNRAALDRQRNG